MRVVVLASVASAAVLAATARPAHACSCDNLLRVTPGDGAEDVPLNVEIVVDSGPYGSPAGGPPAYVLTGPAGPVDLTIERIAEQPTYSIDLVRPVEPLQPSTTYSLSDGDPPDSWPNVMTTFHTGTMTDTAAPPPMAVGELVLAYAAFPENGGNSCGSEYYFIDLPFELPTESAAVDIFVDATDHYVITAEKIPWGLSNLDDACGITIPLEAGREYCFEVRARDLAGNLGPATEQCATVTACPDLDPDGDFTPDLTDCNDTPPDPPPSSDGCSTGSSQSASVVLLLLVAALARRRSDP